MRFCFESGWLSRLGGLGSVWGTQETPQWTVAAVASASHLCHCSEVGHAEQQGQGFLPTLKSKLEGHGKERNVFHQSFCEL